MQEYEIRDINLWESGQKKLDWAAGYMPLMQQIRQRFLEEKPLAGFNISISIHLEAKTAFLATVLRDGGANVYCTGCNPLSTQDDIAAALAKNGFPVFAVHGADEEQYVRNLQQTLSCKPHLILDDGGDLLHQLSTTRHDLAENVIAGTEETTTGVMRMRQMEKNGTLPFAMIAVNDASCKHLFDNRFGTGQSTMDALMRNTNLLVAGKQVVVSGYGWCGRGVAMRAKGLGARVIVTEIDPVRALEAAMEGFEVMSMDRACSVGDVFITVTGCRDILRKDHFKQMKNGALLANAGHFDVEINIPELKALSVETFESRRNVDSYRMEDGRVLHLLAEGRLLNIAAGDGHPVEIMDMSFAVQALCLEYLAKHGRELKNNVYSVPLSIDHSVATMKVLSMGMTLDKLSDDQNKYLGKEA